MTFQQELQKSQKEWLEQGIDQGIKQANRIAVIGFHEKGSSISDIAEVLHLSIDQVEEILSSDSNDSDENKN